MAGNNTNIMHVNASQGLLSEVARRLNLIEPDKLLPDMSNANSFSDQTIAKEEAIEGLKVYEECDIHKLQQAYE